MSSDLLIVPVLRHYGADPPTESGGWREIKCPFHDDTKASGRYSPDAGAFKCQACCMMGNAITLIARVEGVDNSTAYGIYAEIARRSGHDVSGPTEWQSGGSVPAEPRAFERNRRRLSSRVRRKPPFA